MQRLLVLVLVSAVALVGPGSMAPQALGPAPASSPAPSVVTFDRHGTFAVNGARFFPIGLTMPPPLAGRTLGDGGRSPSSCAPA